MHDVRAHPPGSIHHLHPSPWPSHCLCSWNPFWTTLTLLRRSDVPTLRLRFPALRSAELSQTFNGLLAPISLYNSCTLMDSLGLYTLFASCSLHVFTSVALSLPTRI